MPTVLITGTSTGFGHLTTELLAARGWRVFATMRDLKRKDFLERALKEAGLSERVTFLQLDVTDPAIDRGCGQVRPGGDRQHPRRGGAQCRYRGCRRARGSARRRDQACDGDELLRRARAHARASADVPRARTWPHRSRLEPGGTCRTAGKLDVLRLQMGARRMGRVPRLRGRSLRHRRRGHRAWPLSHRDLEQHDLGEAFAQRLSPLAAGSCSTPPTGIRPRPHAIRRRWRRRSSRRSKRAVRASAIRSVPSPSWTISCAARCRRSSSAEAQRAISGCRWRGGRSAPRRARRRGRRASWRRCRELRFRAGRRCRRHWAPALRR